MAPSLRRATLVLFLTCAASFASAQPPGSLDTWVDACQAPEPDLQALLASEALIVDLASLKDNEDGTFTLVNEPFQQGTNSQGLPEYQLCSHSRFYGETRVEVPATFRSAVQVGPDLVVTAWHFPVTTSVETLRVVFGVHGRLIGSLCLPPDFDHIPASDIYEVEVVADGFNLPENVDYLLLRLDRPAGNTYPRVRRSGRGYPGDAATVVSHPERLAAKVDRAGVVGGLDHSFAGKEMPQFANVHTLSGSSGSMFYNRTQRILETIASSGPVGGALELDPGADCYVAVHQDGWESTNASLRYFAHHIPAFELGVNSLDWVVLKARVGDPISHQSVRRMNGPPGGQPVAYQIVAPVASPPGEPALAISPGGPLQGTLAPGQVMAVQQTATTSANVPCDIYERTYLIRDLTHGFEDVARHVFEIGKRGFTVTGGRDGFDDLAAPFEEFVAYTVTNTEPSGFTLRVTADQPWVSFNEAPGPLDVTFAPGDVKQVRVGVLDSYASLPHPLGYEAQLTFAVAPDWSGCPASPPVTRTFVFNYGTETFTVLPGVIIPDASANGVAVNLPVGEDACIGDLNVRLRTLGVTGSQLLFRLRSPGWAGIERVIWDHGPQEGDTPLDVTLDGGILAEFEGLGTSGTWTLTAVDTVPSPGPGTLEEFGLIVTACTSP